jgi:hypothetical protein
MALLAGCVVETVAPEEGPADGAIGGACERTADCDPGLVCPAGGHLADHCAAECDGDADCVIAAGNGYYCLVGVCTKVCRDACEQGAMVASCAASERCVPHRSIEPNVTDCLSWCVP